MKSDILWKKELTRFGDIVDHNILDNFLTNLDKHNQTEYSNADISPTNPSLAVIVKKKQTHSDLAQYLHAACFSPVKSTFATAITKNLQDMAGINSYFNK